MEKQPMNEGGQSSNYQTIPQSGAPAPPYPNEAPPKYEDTASEYPPQAPQYPPQQPQAYTQQTVYQQPIVITGNVGFTSVPRVVICQHCQAHITTTLTYETGSMTWLAAGILCFFGCWLGCCLIPFCIPDLQDVKHTCPNCNNIVGIYRRL